MTYEIIWSDEAFAAAQRYMADDPPGLSRVFETVDLLASDPRPDGAFVWGTHRFRLRVDKYRVIYEIAEKRITIVVMHLGRTG